MRILLLEDEPKVSALVKRGLIAERYAVDIIADGREGLEYAEAYPYDLILLDLMLHGMSGVEVLQRIRRTNQFVPVLVLTARDTIDGLLNAGFLHRGLLIVCPACTHAAFIPIEDVATTIRCPRCLHESNLTRDRWRLPVEEPQWYYDLHPIARALLRENGHVPLLLSQHLRCKSDRGYTDAPEFELMVSGDPAVETDLLALVDRQLVASEAKSTNTFGNDKREAARKRVLAARVLVADEIGLATTQDSWEAATIGALKSAIRAETWPSGSIPRVRTISKLGTPQVTDTIENIWRNVTNCAPCRQARTEPTSLIESRTRSPDYRTARSTVAPHCRARQHRE